MYVNASRAQRSGAALAAAMVVGGLAALLVFGLRVEWLPRGQEVLVSIGLSPRPRPTPPPRAEVRKAATSAAKGAASPRNLKNRATPVVALPVPVLLPPPPVVTATLAGTGAAANTGAAPVPGPGQGAGGIGNGLGGGGRGGDGGGDGDGEPAVVGPRRIAGKLAMGDVPEGTLPPGVTAEVTVLYRVKADGRVDDCQIDSSSGYPAINALACRLIEQRFRYRPARGRSGRPVASRVIETHSWHVEPAPPEPPPRR